MDEPLSQSPRTHPENPQALPHLVIGGGNLGLDLTAALHKRYIPSQLYTKALGCDVLHSYELEDALKHRQWGGVWYCVGQGSVEDAEEYPHRTRAIHVRVPEMILNTLRKSGTPTIFFSSDYAADERSPSSADRQTESPKSHYAELKIELENLVLGSDIPQTAVVRVCSLYGAFKPSACFPGKIRANRDKVRKDGLPLNLVTPTPTEWLANTLVLNLDRIIDEKKPTRHHCAPAGYVTVHGWGELVLEHAIPFRHDRYDRKRPLVSELGCSFWDHDKNKLVGWEVLWDFNQHYFAKKA